MGLKSTQTINFIWLISSTIRQHGDIVLPIVPSLPTIHQLVKQKSDRISFLEANGMLVYQIYTFAVVSYEPV